VKPLSDDEIEKGQREVLTMDAFNRCPECGEIDVRRTRCACGYGADAPTSIAPQPAAPTVKPGTDEDPFAPGTPPDQAEGSDGVKERCLGAFFLFIGLVLSYLSVYEPLAAAARNEEKVTLSLKGAILCPVAVVLGLMYLILGKKATELAGTREKPSPFAWILGLGLVLVGVVLYFYLSSVLAAKGYQ
jgi:uncharacterized protein YjeT (DUF2065 family)